jgi:3-keto-disaccharide hydrolase
MRAAIAVLLAVTLGSVSLSAPVQEGGFKPLFDGKSLAGWKPFLRAGKDGTPPDPKATWSIKDGAIICTGKPNGYIVTEKEYGDYVLKLKWRFPAGSKGGNSGVLLHVTGPDKVWPNSIEAQLFAGSAGDFWLIADDKGQLPKLELNEALKDPKNKEGRHYFRFDKDSPVEKPFGEWNEYEITCKGGDITLVVNGKKVNEGKNGQLKKGRIALQSEGAEVHFKDIMIRSLE